MKDLVEFYQKIMGFKDSYAVIKGNCVTTNPHAIDGKLHRCFLKGYRGKSSARVASYIGNTADQTRVDVPVWFGNYKSSVRIMVVGQQAKKADPEFNLESRGGKIFAAIFAADHWHLDCRLHKAQHLAYRHAFESLLEKAKKGKYFVVFTDLFKKGAMISRKGKKNKTCPNGIKNTEQQKDVTLLKREIKLINPTEIIALGNEVSDALEKEGICHEKVSHPSWYQNLARIEIDEIVRKISKRRSKIKKRIRAIFPAIIIGMLFAAQVGTSATYYVSTNGNDSAAGISWTTAKKTIQAGVNLTTDGDTVWVTNGTYVLTGQVTVARCITIRSVNGPAVTIVNGNGQVTFSRCFYLVASAILDGLTITNGFAILADGGGVYASASVIITNCFLTGNTADNSGGGFFSYHMGTLNNCMLSGNRASGGAGASGGTLNNCTLSGNSADTGGGASVCTLNNCTLSGNTAAGKGGGAMGSSLNNCTLTGNSATNLGGGAYGNSSYPSTLNNCTLSGNTAAGGGGAASEDRFWQYACTLNNCTLIGNEATSFGGGANEGILNNCTLIGNKAGGYGGGGVSGGTLNNCKLIGNSATSQGGGAYSSGGWGGIWNNCELAGNSADTGGGAAGGTLNNCTLIGNEATSSNGGGVYQSALYNSIVYFNSGTNNYGSATVRFTCALDAPVGPGNITNAPMLINPGSGYGTNHVAGNYRLLTSSHCIDHGNNEYASTDVDLDGNMRIWNITVDMGAYEFGSLPPAPSNLVASDGSYADKILISWNSVLKATNYEVWRYTNNNSGLAGKITNTVATNCDDMTAAAGILYYYWAKAISAAGTSDFSLADSGYRSTSGSAPSAPTGVTASDGTYTDKVHVAWTASSGASGYQIFRYTADFSASAAQIGSAASTVFDDTGAVAGTIYYYWVKATSAAGASAFSASDSGSMAAVSVTISPPEHVQAGDGTYTNKVRISWNAVSEATSYQVWRNASNDLASANLLATTASASYDDTSATTPGLTLYYWVKAKNDSGVSAFSQPDAGYCGASGAAGTADLALRGFLFQPSTILTNAHPEMIMLVAVNNGPDLLADSGIGFDFYLSRNTVFGDGDDEWIGDYAATVSIEAAGYTSVIVSDAGLGGITIPPAASGAYYVFARVRHTSALLDPNMTNNVAMRSGAITVGGSEGALEPVAGDFDGDRLADPCVYQESTGNWFVKLSAGGYGLVELEGFGGEGWKAEPGDFDGDRKSDPAIYEEASGKWQVCLSGFGYAKVSTTLGGLGYAPVSGDFNGGGSSDLAVYREATGYWLCLLTETEAPLAFKFGQDGYAPVTGDYTGDGMTDLALYQESTGSWFVKQGDEIYSLLGFGGVGYQPVIGDYDGDGKADLMLYQAISGNWQVRLSASGYAIATLEGFGGPDYFPVSGDYDGDGKADLVLYNIAIATWLFRLSSLDYAQVSTTF